VEEGYGVRGLYCRWGEGYGDLVGWQMRQVVKSDKERIPVRSGAGERLHLQIPKDGKSTRLQLDPPSF